jgi:hypothetical protein
VPEGKIRLAPEHNQDLDLACSNSGFTSTPSFASPLPWVNGGDSIYQAALTQLPPDITTLPNYPDGNSSTPERSAKLAPTFPATDILGALRLTSQIFALEQATNRRVLVLFSDMRNHTSELNLETKKGLTVGVEASGLTGRQDYDLKGVEVFAIGVEQPAMPTDAWQQLYRGQERKYHQH